MTFRKDQTEESQRENKTPAEYTSCIGLNVEETRVLELGYAVSQPLSDGRMIEIRIKDKDQGRFKVRCRVSGGVTGTREGYLKDDDDKIIRFHTKAEAEAEATRLNEKMGGSKSTASFSYWAE